MRNFYTPLYEYIPPTERNNEMNIIVKATATTIKIIAFLITALVIVGVVGLAIVYQQQCGFSDNLLDLSANQIYNRASGVCERIIVNGDSKTYTFRMS